MNVRTLDEDDDTAGRWSAMRFLVLVDETNGREYLRRLVIFQTPLASMYLHRMEVPDPGEDVHDHPWWFASLILRGGYDETIASTREAPLLAEIAQAFPETCRRGIVRSWRRWSVHAVRLDQAHRIHRLHRDPTWTLVLTGPRRRSWGFYMPTGYADHRRYDHASLRAIDERTAP